MTAPLLNECYDVLGLRSDTFYTEVQLRKAYLKRARETHPDTNPQDSQATEAFQHLTQCYETVRVHQSKCANQPYVEPSKVDIEKYKQAYEALLCKIKLFWNDSTEAQVVKQLWQTWSERQRTEPTIPEPDEYTTNTDSRARTYPPPTDAEVKPCEYAADVDTDTDIHFVLQIPLIDVYHKAPQKLSFFRRRWNPHALRIDEEEASLLVHTEHRETAFFGEGHCIVDRNKSTCLTTGCGDVCVVVVPLSDAMCRVDCNGVLHCKVDITCREMRGRPKLINLYGNEYFFVVPEDCESDISSSVVIQNSGLYDVETMQRAELIVDCILRV